MSKKRSKKGAKNVQKKSSTETPVASREEEVLGDGETDTVESSESPSTTEEVSEGTSPVPSSDESDGTGDSPEDSENTDAGPEEEGEPVTESEPALIDPVGDTVQWMDDYEREMKPNREVNDTIVANAQRALYRGIMSVIKEGENNTIRFTDILNRFHQKPCYDLLLVTRGIAINTPTVFPHWYAGLLHIIVMASDPVERINISSSVDLVEPLSGIPEKHLSFLTQYFVSISL